MSTSFWAGYNLGAALSHALRRRERTLEERGEHPEPAAPAVCAPSRSPARNSYIDVYMERLCYVRSDYAVQWRGVDHATGEVTYGWRRVGKHAPDACELTPDVVLRHLHGDLTAGTYLLAPDNSCRLLVLDHDDKRIMADGSVIPEDGLAHLQDCRERLRQQGIDSAVSESRRGGHLFVFLEQAVPARDARALAMLALGPDEVERMHQGQQAFEIYPKADTARGIGSNIALPLGIHLKDGRRHPFIDRHGDAVATTMHGQLAFIAGIEQCSTREVLQARSFLYDDLDQALHPVRAREEPDRALGQTLPRHSRESGFPASQDRTPFLGPSPIAQWKAGVDCRDIAQSYGVQLDHNGVGRCPFHDDQHASFQVWADGWRCYAENRGGDALHFVMEQEGMSPKEALAYVRGHFPVPGLDLTESQPSGRA